MTILFKKLNPLNERRIFFFQFTFTAAIVNSERADCIMTNKADIFLQGLHLKEKTCKISMFVLRFFCCPLFVRYVYKKSCTNESVCELESVDCCCPI